MSHWTYCLLDIWSVVRWFLPPMLIIFGVEMFKAEVELQTPGFFTIIGGAVLYVAAVKGWWLQ